jgi:hypothetical protein
VRNPYDPIELLPVAAGGPASLVRLVSKIGRLRAVWLAFRSLLLTKIVWVIRLIETKGTPSKFIVRAATVYRLPSPCFGGEGPPR